MKLRDDWRVVLRKAWSARFAYIAFALQGAAAASFVLASYVDPTVFAAITIALYVAAGIATLCVPAARVVQQKDIT